MPSSPAARITDPITHDLIAPSGLIGPPPTPPLGGVVNIEGKPAAYAGCIVMCTGATSGGLAHPPPGAGAPPVPIFLGSPTVRINGRPAARWVISGDLGGCTCQLGDPKLAPTRTVFIGGPVAPAGFPFKLTAKGDLWFGKAIGIGGDERFKSEVAVALIMIATVPAGMRLIQSLESSGKLVGIHPTKDNNGYCQATDLAAATLRGAPVFDGKGTVVMVDEVTVAKGTGTGSDSVVLFNPDFKLANPSAPDQPEPTDAVLYHELEHANHNAHGKQDCSPIAGYDTNEEKNTIDEGENSENQYLVERGYFWQRTDHHGSFVPLE
jgi:uncharacterized Zn-binding protein involved in type VI secretion